jgi:flagellar export protein FliJ
MKRTPKRYKTLLRIRKQSEDQESQKHATAMRNVHNAQREHEELEEYQKQVLERAGNLQRTNGNPADLRALYQYERHLAQTITEKEAVIVQLKQKQQAQRDDLVEAMKQRRVIEQLMENIREEEKEIHSKFEQKQVDETNSIRTAYLRKQVQQMTGETHG